MASPNRTVASWGRSKPTFKMVSQTSFRSLWDAEHAAEVIRATKEFDRVSVSRLKVGQQDQNGRVFFVRCYKKI